MRATTRPLPVAVDLNDVAAGDGYLFVRDGVGFAGRGAALRVPLDDAVKLLADIDHDDAVGGVGTGPIALGCLPFRPGADAEMVVPALIVGKAADGRAWLTTISDDDTVHDPDAGGNHSRAIAELTAVRTPATTAARFTIEPVTPIAHYLDAVRAVRDAVARGEVVKAVIAREIKVSCDEPIDIHGVLRRLKASFGSSYRYSIDGFIGASPELLVEVAGDIVRAHPLAGTAPRTGDPGTDARLAADLVESTKDQVEHRVVIDVVHDTLLPWCSYLDWEPDPSVVAVANVQHLGSRVEGRLSRPRPAVTELARALSPTPALGGHPRAEALALIAAVEGVERGRYGGAVGWVDAHGNGTWAVAIRCADFAPDRRSARLFAGGGIVADSEPDAELAETQAKFQAMLSAIVRA